MELRISPQTVLVLTEFLQDPSKWKYGYEISCRAALINEN
jgi:hypothetical protein